jgi:adenylate cyclase
MASTRRLAAILAADVVGYSRLMGADEEGTHERVKGYLVELVDPKIGEHHGRIVKNTGDGVLAEFGSVVEAVRCAAEIQRAMADRDLDLAEERRLRFRIGVNLGDVIADGDDIYGDGVNIAARLEGLAAPGGICVSGTVRDHIGDRLPYAFEDMGEQSVKNIARPVRVYALRREGVPALPAPGLPARLGRRYRAIIGMLAAAALAIVCIAWWFWPAAISPSEAGKPADQAAAPATPMATAPAATSISQPLLAPRLSIVVLPFVNLSNDPDQQYFADGITEDLTIDLSRISNSFVISRDTAFTYRNKPVGAKQIGRELGVRYVLGGSVRRSGDKVRVNTQLIDAETEAHLWTERFDSDTGNLLTLQNEITSRIAVALNIELTSREAARPTEHPDALDYILRGRAAYWKPNSLEKWVETVSLFERALTLDPQSVEAQSWLAAALTFRVASGYAYSATLEIQRAEELVGKALAASPHYWFAHYAKGSLRRVVQHRCEEAIPEYEIALALNPYWMNTLVGLGSCKLLTGSIEEVIPLCEQAIRISPRDPYISIPFFQIGVVYLLQSRTDEAIVWLERARSAFPGNPDPHAWLSSAYALKGETERAAAELEEARREGNYVSIAGLKTVPDFGMPKTRALFEATYFAGLRKAGMPEE